MWYPGLAPCPRGGPQDFKSQEGEGEGTGSPGQGAGWPHPPSPRRSSTRHKSHWCLGCRRSSHRETRLCRHSSLPVECGWDTWQEHKVGGVALRDRAGLCPAPVYSRGRMRSVTTDAFPVVCPECADCWFSQDFSTFTEMCIVTAIGD